MIELFGTSSPYVQKIVMAGLRRVAFLRRYISAAQAVQTVRPRLSQPGTWLKVKPENGRVVARRLRRIHVPGKEPKAALGTVPRSSRSVAEPVTSGVLSPVVVAPARYVLPPVANAIAGCSVKALERKIERGDSPEGRLWKRAPDGHIFIDIMGYQKWVESR